MLNVLIWFKKWIIAVEMLIKEKCEVISTGMSMTSIDEQKYADSTT